MKNSLEELSDTIEELEGALPSLLNVMHLVPDLIHVVSLKEIQAVELVESLLEELSLRDNLRSLTRLSLVRFLIQQQDGEFTTDNLLNSARLFGVSDRLPRYHLVMALNALISGSGRKVDGFFRVHKGPKGAKSRSIYFFQKPVGSANHPQ